MKKQKVTVLSHNNQWWKIVKEVFHDYAEIECRDCGFRVRDLTRVSYSPVLIWGINILCPPRKAIRCQK